MTTLDEFKRLKRYVEAALAHNFATQDIADVERRLQAGTFSLWPAENAFLITEVCTMPSKSFLNIALGGGKLEQVRQLVSQVESVAQQQGRDGVMVIGRRGWLRALPGYRHAATVCIKEF